MTALQKAKLAELRTAQDYKRASAAFGRLRTPEARAEMLESFAAMKNARGELPKEMSLREAVEIYALRLLETRQTGKRCGRPSKLTMKLATELCATMTGYRSIAAAADELGIPIQTVWSWRQRNEAFGELVKTTRRLMAIAAGRSPEYAAKRQRRRHRVFKRLTDDLSAPGYYGGRPTKYRPEYANWVCETYTETARELGVGRRTLFRWAKRYPEFRRAQLEMSFLRSAMVATRRADRLIEKWNRERAKEIPAIVEKHKA